MSKKTRTAHDSMGELQVPADALWGAQTQRAIANFQISDQRMPAGFIRAVALIKAAAADANQRLGLLDEERAQAIVQAAVAIARGEHAEQFPLDVFQTGSATSSNMNVNEVIAELAARASVAVHANDHVNMSQSSNDVVPCAIQLSALIAVKTQLLPAIKHLRTHLDRRARSLRKVVKTGRTHLMDAMPLTFGQELGAWSAQLAMAAERTEDAFKRLRQLPLGGTAIGTGINAHPKFAEQAIKSLAKRSGIRLVSASNLFVGIAGQDAAVELSGQLNGLAVALMKIANDLRWMNSGPLAGLGEIALPALQPGSSIMPGKVNPVIPEAVCMVCAEVMGGHVSVTIAAQSGNFQLNTMLPLIAYRLLNAIEILSNAMRALADKAIAGFSVRKDVIEAALSRNPILVTALNPLIGYEQAAAIAKQAYETKQAVLAVTAEMTDLPLDVLTDLLDPTRLAFPHAAKSVK